MRGARWEPLMSGKKAGKPASTIVNRKVVVASGYFNPLHYGHVSYLERAKEAGGTLIVVVNNDKQAAFRLKGSAGVPGGLVMPARDRVRTVRSLACVDAAVEAVDEDESVCMTLRLLHPDIFANGGARSASEKEIAVCRELGIQILNGLGIEVLVLTPFTQHYDWGKQREDSLVAALTGEHTATGTPSAPRTFAELWMGDHPSGPSSVQMEICDGSGNSLGKTLLRTPTLLGSHLANEAKLPFLLKVLSIEKALSIQAHPDRALAKKLHRERPDVYKDPNHKPEIAIALTDFEALCGFRHVVEIFHFALEVPELAEILGEEVVQTMRSSVGDAAKESRALKAAYCKMIRTPDEITKPKVRDLVSRTSSASHELHPPRLSTCLMLVHRLHRQFGDDPGIFSVFFLNYSKMSVGECLYMPQNTPHAYLSGDIVECMATSDNVVRGGLTGKYKDIEILCEMLRYQGGDAPQVFPEEPGPGVLLYADPSITEFQVTHVRLPAKTKRRWCFSNMGPTVAFASRGRGSVKISGDTVSLAPGVVFFLAAGVDAELSAEEELEVFAACCPPHYFNA